MDKATDFFRDLGIFAPRLNAIAASSTECFGGLLLLAGLGGRLVAVPLSVTMTVAYLTAHRANFASVDKFVEAPPFPFLMVALTVLAFGPGKFSVDYLLRRLAFKREDRPTLPGGPAVG